MAFGKKEKQLLIIGGTLGAAALLYYLWPKGGNGGEQCQAGYHKDPITNQCVPDPIQCGAGFHYDAVTNTCVPDDQPYPGQVVIHVTPILTGTVPKVIVNIRNITGIPANGWFWQLEHPFGVSNTGTDRQNGFVTGVSNIDTEISFPTSNDEDSNHFAITAGFHNKDAIPFRQYIETGFIHITGQRPNWNIVYQVGSVPS